MNGGRITLTTSEQRRLIVLNHLESGALVNAEAARLVDLSVRQLQRMKAAYVEFGAAALAHGNRGRRPVHALDPELARKVVELATTTYAGFNQQHLTELLVEEHADPGPASIASSPRPASRRPVSGDRLGTDAGVIATPRRACFYRSTPAGTTGWKGGDPT
jgi:hypothetical protein